MLLEALQTDTDNKFYIHQSDTTHLHQMNENSQTNTFPSHHCQVILL